MRTLLVTIAAIAIIGCASQAQQRGAKSVASATTSPAPVVHATVAHVAVATPSPIPATTRPSVRPSTPKVLRTPSPAVSARPTNTPAPSPSAAPSQTAPPTPVPATATPDPVLLLPPDAAPEIVAMHIDRTTVHGGDTVSGWVVTSSNVASVEARIGYYSIPVPKISIGHFALNYVVPHLPFFLHRTYAMEVIARNVAGVAVVRTIPIRVR